MNNYPKSDEYNFKEEAKGLVYFTPAPGQICTERRILRRPLKKGEIFCQLKSCTLCSTDISNIHGILGHTNCPEAVLGHENCSLVLESKCSGIEPGQYIIPLGDDWNGLSEYQIYTPVTYSTDPAQIKLKYSERGGYYDPDTKQHVKAVCVIPAWRSGISLIEPLTHVYTAVITCSKALSAKSVVILGAGACGLFFAKFLKILGTVQKITFFDTNNDRLVLARRLGLADITINPITQVELCNEFIATTHGEYADLVCDALPGIIKKNGSDTRYLGMKLLKRKGWYILYSAAEKMSIPGIAIVSKGIRIHVAAYDSHIIDFPQRAMYMKKVHQMIDRGLINTEEFISRQIDFRDKDSVLKLFREYGNTSEIKVEIIA